MTRLATIVARFPDREFAIRRLCARPEFSLVCNDYEEMAAALGHCISAEPSHSARVEEYREALAELEREILRALSADVRPAAPPSKP